MDDHEGDEVEGDEVEGEEGAGEGGEEEEAHEEGEGDEVEGDETDVMSGPGTARLSAASGKSGSDRFLMRGSKSSRASLSKDKSASKRGSSRASKKLVVPWTPPVEPLTPSEKKEKDAGATPIQSRIRGIQARKRAKGLQEALNKSSKMVLAPRNHWHPTDRALLAQEHSLKAAAAKKRYWSGASSLDESEAPWKEEGPPATEAYCVKTPVPAGARGTKGQRISEMALNGQLDSRFAFNYLDTKKAGKLYRNEARIWFRYMGWCVPEAELDQMLNDDKPSTKTGQWSLLALLTIAEKRQDKPNSSVAELDAALVHLARNNAKLNKDRLIKVTVTDSGLIGDLGQILRLIEIRKNKPLECETIAKQVIGWICEAPPELKQYTAKPTTLG